MNNRKVMLRRIVAFVSALSFITVSNYTGLCTVSAEFTEQRTAAVNTGEEESTPGVTMNPEDTTLEPSYPGSDSSATQQMKYGVQFSQSAYEDANEMNSVVQNLCQQIKNQLDSMASEVTFDNDRIIITYALSVDATEITAALNELEINFTYDQKSKYYCYKFGNGYINMEEFYRLTDERSDSKIKSVIIDEANLTNFNSNSYVKSGTSITITPADGYHLDPNNSSIVVSGPVNITDSVIKMNDVDVIEVKENKFSIIFDTKGSDITIYFDNNKVDNKIENITWSEYKDKTIRFYYNSNYSVYQNDNFLADIRPEQNYLLSEFMQKVGLPFESSYNNEEYYLRLEAVPGSLAANYIFHDRDNKEETEDVTMQIVNKHVQIPYMITKNMNGTYKTFYLQDYAYIINGTMKESPVFTTEYIWKALSGGKHYNTDVLYQNSGFSRFKITYQELESTPDADRIRNAILNTNNGNMDGKRNDSVYSVKPEKRVLSLGPDSEFADKEILVFDSDFNSKVLKTALITTEGETEDYTLTLESGSSKFYKFSMVYDEGTPAAFTEPFYLYIDRTNPKLTEPYAETDDPEGDTTLYKDTDGWSNEVNLNGCGLYRFSIDISDNEEISNPESLSAEQQEAYNLINDNQNLNSIASVTVGDYLFKRPAGGWNSKSYITGSLISSDATPEYTAALYPQKDEDGNFNGTCKVILTLKTKAENYSEKLTVKATDDCNNSDNKTVDVKIDINAPEVESIAIDGLLDGLDSDSKILSEGTNLKVTATITDEAPSSSIESVKICYGNNEQEAERKNGVYSAEFIVADNNLNDIVTIISTDKAGNESTYYYSADEDASNVTKDKDAATPIITDNTAPEIKELILDECNYQDNEHRQWYAKYPDMTFEAADKGTSVSGLNSIIIDINGVEMEFYAKTDMKDFPFDTAIQNGTLYLHFVADETDNQKFTAYLSNGLKNFELTPPLGTELQLTSEGQLQVSVWVTDCANNLSNESSTTVYIDNNNPLINDDSKFEVENAENSRVLQTKYGTFANHQITVGVRISDTENNVPSSGYQKAVLTYAGAEYPTTDIRDNVAYFTIPMDVPDNSAIEGEMEIVLTDNVGNESVQTLLVSGTGSSVVGVENIKPVISEPVVEGDNLYVNANDEHWYNSDITVSYSISDADSGLANADYGMYNNGTNEPEDQTKKDYTDIATKTTADDDFTLTTAKGDGLYTFRMTVHDNADNAEEQTVNVYKDVSMPYISGFKFDRYDEARDSVVMGGRFDYFYDDSTVLTVSAMDDKGASAGIQTIYCVLYNTDGSVFRDYSTSELNLDNGVYSAGFLIPEGFKGDIEAWTTDNVTNTSEKVSPDGFVSENETRHQSSASLDIVLPETQSKDTNGLPLYNHDITAHLTAVDRFSGIRAIDWLTSDFSGWENAEIDRNGGISGGNWTTNSTERNLVTEVSRDITVSKDANSDEIRLRITDNSGNSIEKEVQFSIDKKAPVIHVAGLEKRDSSKDEFVYYANDITARITITERNFQAPTINGKTEGGFRADPTSLPETDEYRHLFDQVYNEDGVYELDIECTDLAGNEANKYSSGKFVIDKTDPLSEVHFYKGATQSAEVDPDVTPYINSTLNAVLTVTDVNFDPKDVTVTINETNYSHTADDWDVSNSGAPAETADKVYTLKIPESEFSEDGVYTVAISGKDLAGNAFEDYKTSFEIDLVDPVIEMSGYAAANKGEISPTVDITDKNIETYSLSLYRNGSKDPCKMEETDGGYRFKIDDGVYVTGRWEIITEGQHVRFVFDNFPEEEIYDGIYEVKASVEDKATRSIAKTGRFSVNRFGSTFIIEEEEKLNGKYLNKAPTVVITEINVDMHDEDSDVITIVDKGSTTVQLTEDEEYSFPSEPEMLDDKSGYFYTYTIMEKNFEQDLDYKVTIQTMDAAGTQNVSTNRGGDLAFVVDTHEPQFECDNLDSNMEFRGSEMTFKLNANEKLQHILITCGNDTLLDDTTQTKDNSYSFTVPASNAARSITVELTDLAGNETIVTYDNLLVTENVAVYLLHKTWVKVTGIASLIGVGGLAGALALVKRKKKNRLD